MALLDGYTREAVTSMVAALERFIEFYILIICLAKGKKAKDFASFWRLVGRQSERQIGAFLVLSLLEENQTIPDLNERANFRNKVIHQGYLPSVSEAIDYGEYVLGIIFPILKDLREKYPKQLDQADHMHLSKKLDLVENSRITSSSGPTIINMQSLYAADFGETTFEEALEQMKTESYSRICFVRSM
ncbi:MAG: hypothetical protein IPG58_03650 [Acidobacteria bacterium]|nr:hypothetical protein [Acidobacteriota bacterium]